MVSREQFGGETIAAYALDVFRALDDRLRCSRVIVALILIIALSVRLAFSVSRPSDAASLANLPDQVEYLALAKSILAGKGLSMVDPRFNDTVVAFRMPGYPLLCAALRCEIQWIRIAQSVLGTSTVLATLWLSRRWLSPALSFIAALFVALDPIQIYFCTLILSETMFTCLLTWGIACLVHGRSPMARGAGATLWWLGAVLLVMSIYVRPSALIWPVVIAGAAVFHEHGTTFFKPGRRVPVVTLLALLTAIALLPWGIRNRATLGHWIFLTTNDGFTLYDSWNRDSDGRSDQSSIAQLPLVAGLNEVQRSEYLRSQAVSSLRNDPLRLMRRVPTKLARLWTPWPLSTEFGSKRLYVIGAASHAIPLFLLALVGAMRSTLSGRARVLLLTPALLITIAHGATIGSLRYRMPAHPEMAILAAASLIWSRRVSSSVESGDSR